MTRVIEVGPERAEEVLAVIHAGFGARVVLDPPSSATEETTRSVTEALAAHGGLLAVVHEHPVGALLFEPHGDLLGLRRVAVAPHAQGRGVARALARHAEDVARHRGYEAVRLAARVELPRTVRFWHRLGYREVGRDGPLLTLAKELPVTRVTRSAEESRALGERLAGVLRAGDLLVLTGDLGAGKTTLTQGLGAGLRVRGEVTSPTFVIARVHPSLVDGPALVHVDAYRLGGVAELDDLDLDASLDEAVTVVEWGEGIAEGLAEDRLEVRVTRARAHDAEDEDHDARTVRITPVGARWVGSGVARALGDEPVDALA